MTETECRHRHINEFTTRMDCVLIYEHFPFLLRSNTRKTTKRQNQNLITTFSQLQKTPSSDNWDTLAPSWVMYGLLVGFLYFCNDHIREMNIICILEFCIYCISQTELSHTSELLSTRWSSCLIETLFVADHWIKCQCEVLVVMLESIDG